MLRARAAQAEDLGRMKTQLLGAISSSKAEVLRLKAEKKEVVQRHKVSLTLATCSCTMSDFCCLCLTAYHSRLNNYASELKTCAPDAPSVMPQHLCSIVSMRYSVKYP